MASSISLLSLNVYFGSEGRAQRTKGLLALLLDAYAQVVCLQEVTPFVEAAIRKNADLQRIYVMSPFEIENYGVFMLVDRRLTSLGSDCKDAKSSQIFTNYELPSDMERTLLTVVLDWRTVRGAARLSAAAVTPTAVQSGTEAESQTEIEAEIEAGASVTTTHFKGTGAGTDASAGAGTGNETLCIATCHFESLSSAKTRRSQLALAEQILRPYASAVLCGDFNFDSSRNYHEGVGALENEVLGQVLPSYVDVWPALRPRDAGYTFDTVKNGMVRSMRQNRVQGHGHGHGHSIGKEEQMRYDRVLSRQVVDVGIQLVGSERLPPDLESASASSCAGRTGSGMDLGAPGRRWWEEARVDTPSQSAAAAAAPAGMQGGMDIESPSTPGRLGVAAKAIASRASSESGFSTPPPPSAGAGAGAGVGASNKSRQSATAVDFWTTATATPTPSPPRARGAEYWLSDHFGLMYTFACPSPLYDSTRSADK